MTIGKEVEIGSIEFAELLERLHAEGGKKLALTLPFHVCT